MERTISRYNGLMAALSVLFNQENNIMAKGDVRPVSFSNQSFLSDEYAQKLEIIWGHELRIITKIEDLNELLYKIEMELDIRTEAGRLKTK